MRDFGWKTNCTGGISRDFKGIAALSDFTMFDFGIDPEPVFSFIPTVMNKSVLKSFSLFCVVALVVTILAPAAHAARTKG
ncbi:MAG: hypothetical protein H7X97_00210, partial [Opitutaceae bacterium]|nr:hypothetical protein [Verrucomicrobiales bacterium]